MHQAHHQLHRDVYGHTIRYRAGDGLRSWGTSERHSYVQAQDVEHPKATPACTQEPISNNSKGRHSQCYSSQLC